MQKLRTIFQPLHDRPFTIAASAVLILGILSGMEIAKNSHYTSIILRGVQTPKDIELLPDNNVFRYRL